MNENDYTVTAHRLLEKANHINDILMYSGYYGKEPTEEELRWYQQASHAERQAKRPVVIITSN